MSSLEKEPPRRHRSFDARTTIGEVMTPSPLTIQRRETLAQAYDVMRENGLRHLPVLDGNTLVGVLSQRDSHFVEAFGGGRTPVEIVGQAMAPEVFSVAPRDRIADVARTMGDNRYGCAVVVDVGRVVGVFTATDALALLAWAAS